MSHQGLDIKVVSYKYEGMGQKKETNLVVIVFEVKVSTRELGLDDLPRPVHWRTKHDGKVICWTGEESNELAEGVDDDRTGVPAFGEWTGVAAIALDWWFHRIAVDCCFR